MYAEVTEVSVEIWEARKAYAEVTEVTAGVAVSVAT